MKRRAIASTLTLGILLAVGCTAGTPHQLTADQIDRFVHASADGTPALALLRGSQVLRADPPRADQIQNVIRWASAHAEKFGFADFEDYRDVGIRLGLHLRAYRIRARLQRSGQELQIERQALKAMSEDDPARPVQVCKVENAEYAIAEDSKELAALPPGREADVEAIRRHYHRLHEIFIGPHE